MKAPGFALLLFLALSLSLPQTRADATVGDDESIQPEVSLVEDAIKPEAADSTLKLELEQLRSRIDSLESSIADKTQELKSKDAGVAHLEEVIREKTETISLLKKEIEQVQKKRAVDAAELLEKAHSRADGLEKQIEKLNGVIQTQNQNKDALEARARVAEKRLEELKLKLASLEKTNDEQKQRILKTSRALKAAEEELIKVRQEAALKEKELTKIHDIWLPPWLATQLGYIQVYVTTNWDQHGKPVLDVLVLKLKESSSRVQKRIEPHLNTMKTKWVPILNERWAQFSTFIQPHVQIVSTNAVLYYEKSATVLKPHIKRAREVSDPYIQEVKKFSKPYVDHVATAAKPHVQKARVVLKPYTKKVVHVYHRFLKSATEHHHQTQAFVLQFLEKYDVTKALATKELVWFLASALLILPLYLLYGVFVYFFGKKSQKRSRVSHQSRTHRRPKRRHADK